MADLWPSPELLWQVDIPVLFGLLLVALSVVPPGCYLVVNRRVMLADAIAHSVLPGMVLAFMITGSLNFGVMFLGAVAAGWAGSALIALLARRLPLDPGAAMGVVFTTLFAAGALLAETGAGKGIHLDVEHLLFGSSEQLLWPTLHENDTLHKPGKLFATMPSVLRHQLWVVVCLWVVAAVWRRALVVYVFDPASADTYGYPNRLLAVAVTAVVALVVVGTLRHVGLVLTIAMFVCPAAAARLTCTRFMPMVGVAILWGVGTGWLGYVLSAAGPEILGLGRNWSSAGTIALLQLVLLTMLSGLQQLRRRGGVFVKTRELP